MRDWTISTPVAPLLLFSSFALYLFSIDLDSVILIEWCYTLLGSICIFFVLFWIVSHGLRTGHLPLLSLFFLEQHLENTRKIYWKSIESLISNVISYNDFSWYKRFKEIWHIWSDDLRAFIMGSLNYLFRQILGRNRKNTTSTMEIFLLTTLT